MALFVAKLSIFVSMLFIICWAKNESQQIFSQIIKMNVKFNRSPIAEESVGSAVECCRLCHSNPLCKAVNYIAKKQCEILDDIPLDPNTLIADEQSEYWEKTCQPSFGIVAANSDNNVLRTIISADWGLNTYYLTFNPSLSQTDVSFVETVEAATMGQHKTVLNVATMRYHQNSTSITLIEDGNGWTSCNLDSTACPGPGSWPKHFEQLTNGNRVWALLSNKNGDGVYAFSNDKVIEVATPLVGSWPIINRYDLDDNSEENIWRNVPKGVIAASWIPQNMPGFRNAFLATIDYYIVFDIITHNVIHRSHLCRPVL
ncbi:uncharacterized protein LOC126817496 [Patella vulgata]|uniref:uncharacterized protein LOC126817496 n=1 Tax=Patella vulgata TaxID=6465 RepID=UPI0021806073|nr:uncharacterized protein LOC126817496 [Patella vulgata]